MNIKTTAEKKSDKKPWFRHPMVWMVILIPFSSMVMGGVMLRNAIVTFDGLVEDDYYKYGKEINSRLDRDDFASEHDITAILTLQKGLPVLTAQLEAQDIADLPKTLKVRFIHPTRQGVDVETQLLKQDNGEYVGALVGKLAPGKWLLRLETSEFRLQRSLVLPYSGDVVVDNQSNKNP